MDQGDLFFGSLATTPAADNGHLALIAANNPSAQLVGYEFGFGFLGLGNGVLSGSDLVAANNRSIAASLHPRLVGWTFRYLEWLQQYFAFVHVLVFSDEIVNEGGYAKAYGVYKGLSHAPGRGDGSDGLANNLPAITDANGNSTVALFNGAALGKPPGTPVSPYGWAVRNSGWPHPRPRSPAGRPRPCNRSSRTRGGDGASAANGPKRPADPPSRGSALRGRHGGPASGLSEDGPGEGAAKTKGRRGHPPRRPFVVSRAVR